MSSTHTTLAAASDDRKARLAALKTKSLKRKQPAYADEDNDDDDQNTQNSPPTEPPHKQAKSPAPDSPPTDLKPTDRYLSGRNYDLATRGPKLGFETQPNATADTIEARATALAAEVKAKREEEEREEAVAAKPLDLFGLQPKKPNWDLKRDLEKKMLLLNTRTENAIARIVRERVAAKRREGRNGGVGSGGQGVKGSGEGDGEEVGMEGTTLVEAMHVREREEEEEARREREEEES